MSSWKMNVRQYKKFGQRSFGINSDSTESDVLNVFSPLEGTSILVPYHWRAASENNAHWRLLCNEAPELAGLTERPSEGTEDDQAPYTEMCTSPPQGGLPSRP